MNLEISGVRETNLEHEGETRERFCLNLRFWFGLGFIKLAVPSRGLLIEGKASGEVLPYRLNIDLLLFPYDLPRHAT